MYNLKIKSYLDKYVETHRESINAYNCIKYKERYNSDIEFREKENKRINERHMKRYYQDEEYRKKLNDKRKALYHKKKLEQEQLKTQQILA